LVVHQWVIGDKATAVLKLHLFFICQVKAKL